MFVPANITLQVMAAREEITRIIVCRQHITSHGNRQGIYRQTIQITTCNYSGSQYSMQGSNI